MDSPVNYDFSVVNLLEATIGWCLENYDNGATEVVWLYCIILD